ncbi:MAG: glycerol-3-phosphate dehydrogenase/oxidase [Candidatus Binatia bacterium]
MAAETVDMLVIGGGITGAGIARDAALRGLRVALVEKGDFASGTSSRSTKLIHGGLRYLRQGEFSLVREAARERAVLYRIAPQLTLPTPLLVPVYDSPLLGLLTLRLGLWLYEKLGAVTAADRHRLLSADETHRREPLLRQHGLNGAGVYIEYLTDDARLVIDTVKSAARAGALVASYTEARSLLRRNEKISGAIVREAWNHDELSVQARVVVNAAGPWVDTVRALDGVVHGKRLHLTKGIHLVIPRQRLPLSMMVLMVAQDQRLVFAVPRGEMVYIGTTDTSSPHPMERPEISRSEVAYLLTTVNQAFPDVHVQVADIGAAWAGLRPLVHQEGKSPSEISRRDEILVSHSGLISIAGGKLTTYRCMAERVVDLVGKILHEQWGTTPLGRSVTAEHPLTDNQEFSPRSDFRAQPHTFTESEIQYALDEEMVMTVEDFLDRRTSVSLFTPDNGLGHLEYVVQTMAASCDWDTARMQQEMAAYRSFIREMKAFADASA